MTSLRRQIVISLAGLGAVVLVGGLEAQSHLRAPSADGAAARTDDLLIAAESFDYPDGAKLSGQVRERRRRLSHGQGRL